MPSTKPAILDQGTKKNDSDTRAGSIDMEPASLLAKPAPPAGTVINVRNTLPYLLYATQGGLQVSAYAQVPLEYLFDGFPNTVRYAQQNIQVSDVVSVDLSFMSNIFCAPFALLITRNSQLTSLSGLNIWPSGSLRNLTMLENPLLSQSAFAPLGSLLQCEAGSSPQDVSVAVQTVECTLLSNLNQLCNYIESGICPGPGTSMPGQLGWAPVQHAANRI